MANIEITSTPARSSGRRRSKALESRQARINDILAWVLMITICLAPLPFGSVRPFFWAFSGLALGVCGAAYFAILALQREQLRFGLGDFALPAALLAAMGAFLIVQVLPLGMLVGGFGIRTAAGEIFSTNQISIVPGTTFLTLLAFATYGLLFFLLVQASANERRRSLMFNVLLAATVLYGIYGLTSLQLGDTILGLTKWAYAGSATGPFVNRNSFATFLAFSAIIAMAQIGNLLMRRGERHPDDGHVPHNTSSIIVYATAYFILLVAILATQSRMGLLAMIGGTIVVAIITLRSIVRFRGLLAAVAAALVLAIGALATYGQGLVERLGSLEADREVRGDLYAQVLELIQQRPWTGFGGGSFNLAFPLVHRPPVSPDLVWDRAHNSYLTLWAEMGLIAGSIPIVILAIFAVQFARSAFASRTSLLASSIGLAAIVVAAIHSLVDFSLEIHANALLFTAILGLAMGGIKKPRLSA
jgi:O-antigen ligase